MNTANAVLTGLGVVAYADFPVVSLMLTTQRSSSVCGLKKCKPSMETSSVGRRSACMLPRIKNQESSSAFRRGRALRESIAPGA